jgi:signal transduction histidine kinase
MQLSGAGLTLRSTKHHVFVTGAEAAAPRSARTRTGAQGEAVDPHDDDEPGSAGLRRDLIANVSHDLRTPLVALRGYLEVLLARDATLDAAERRHYLGIALRQSEHLARLVDDLFELARLDFKGLVLERETFDLRELASDVLQKFQLRADGCGVRLVLAAEGGAARVDADLGLVERVLENLVGNALRHTPAGGEVAVRLVPEAARVHVEVRDTGSGIAPEDLPRVFERHWRGRAARDDDGAGLGLAIARRIVELHGATLGAESAPGRGTCFGFALALADVPSRRATP